MRIIIILRKKIEGENSIEGLAYNIASSLDAEIICCPRESTSIKNILYNIKYVKKYKADVYHIISPSEAYLLPFLDHSSKRIITYHDLKTIYDSRNALFKIARISLNILPSVFFANTITFVSHSTQDEYNSIWGKLCFGKKRIIYNPYDSRLKRNNSISDDVHNLLQVGTAKRKNLESLIKAISGIKIKLVIIGKLDDDQKKLLTVNNIDYENKYDIRYEEIVDEYIKCDIVCFPTYYEGFGLPIIEANVIGRPVISSDIPIIREIGRDAVYYIDPYRVETIREAVVNLMGNVSERKRLIMNGFENAKRFMPENIIKAYYEEYYGPII